MALSSASKERATAAGGTDSLVAEISPAIEANGEVSYIVYRLASQSSVDLVAFAWSLGANGVVRYSLGFVARVFPHARGPCFCVFADHVPHSFRL